MRVTAPALIFGLGVSIVAYSAFAASDICFGPGGAGLGPEKLVSEVTPAVTLAGGQDPDDRCGFKALARAAGAKDDTTPVPISPKMSLSMNLGLHVDEVGKRDLIALGFRVPKIVGSLNGGGNITTEDFKVNVQLLMSPSGKVFVRYDYGGDIKFDAKAKAHVMGIGVGLKKNDMQSVGAGDEQEIGQLPCVGNAEIKYPPNAIGPDGKPVAGIGFTIKRAADGKPGLDVGLTKQATGDSIVQLNTSLIDPKKTLRVAFGFELGSRKDPRDYEPLECSVMSLARPETLKKEWFHADSRKQGDPFDPKNPNAIMFKNQFATIAYLLSQGDFSFGGVTYE